MATPSGIRHSLTKTFLSEPSGLTEKMRPWLASRKIKRAAAVLLNGARVDFVVRGSVTFVLIIYPFIKYSRLRHAGAATAATGITVLLKFGRRFSRNAVNASLASADRTRAENSS